MISRVEKAFKMGSENRAQPAPSLAAGWPDKYLNVGSFRFWFVGQRWEWSDEVARMHGYEPGSVEPTTELLLSHEHPDDRAHVQDLLDYALHSHASFSSRHRFVDTGGRVHDAIVVADRMIDETGAVLGTDGYYLDLTDTFDATRDETRREVLDEALPHVVEARAVIEQAKGVLMAVYRVNAEHAFRMLRWRSTETNVKVRALAAQLVAEVGTLPATSASAQRQFDHLLLTVHERVPPNRPDRRSRDDHRSTRPSATGSGVESSATELLAVEHEDRGDAIVVRVAGEIDSSTAGELISHLTTAFELAATHPARLVVIDLQPVTFLGSAGLNAVLHCRERGLAAGTSVRLVADNAHVVRPFEMTNLDSVFEIYPTLAAALQGGFPDRD
jgi:anti-anti-sigma factor